MRWFLALAALLSASPAAPAVRDTAQRDAGWQTFRARAGNEWQVVWDPKHGAPQMMRGNTPYPLGPAHTRQDRARAAEAFFTENAALFGLRPGLDAMVVGAEYSSGGMSFVKLHQQYEGLTVLGGDVSLAMDADGGLHAFLGNIVPGISLEPEARLTGEQALASFRSGRASQREGTLSSTGPMIVEVDGRAVLGYLIRAQAGEGETSDYFVDAAHGQVVAEFSHTAYATGSGNVFLRNAFDTLTTVPLPRLDGTGEFLDGQYVSVVAPVPRAHEPSAIYEYVPTPPPEPDLTGFDAVNAYYQIDRFFHDFLEERLGFSGIPNRPLVHVNAGRTLASDDALGCVCTSLHFDFERPSVADNAKDVDLLWHEAAHALVYSVGVGRPVLTVGSLQPAAFHEGMANYFACAFGEDPRWGEATYRDFRNGEDSLTTDPAVFNYGRWNKVAMGASGQADSHSNGAIWSGALWDIRKDLGWTADSLALQFLYYLPAHPDFVQAAFAYRQADLDLHGGRHESTIIARFAARGINIGVLAVHLTGPDELNPLQPGTFNSNRTGGLKPYHFLWEQNDVCSCVQDTACDTWRVLTGKTSSVTARSKSSFYVRVTVTDSSGMSAADELFVNGRYLCGAAGDSILIPQDELLKITPNPAAALAGVSFSLATGQRVRVEAFDLAGRRVATIVDEGFAPGPQTVLWNTRGLPEGLYVLRLVRAGYTESRRVLLRR